MHLSASLRGKATDILQTLPAEKRSSLQDLLIALELLFGDSALRDYHRLQLKTRSQKNAESLIELATEIERLSFTAYHDYPNDVSDSLSLNSSVDAMTDPEIQQALRIADHKDLRCALVHAVKVK